MLCLPDQTYFPPQNVRQCEYLDLDNSALMTVANHCRFGRSLHVKKIRTEFHFHIDFQFHPSVDSILSSTVAPNYSCQITLYTHFFLINEREDLLIR